MEKKRKAEEKRTRRKERKEAEPIAATQVSSGPDEEAGEIAPEAADVE